MYKIIWRHSNAANYSEEMHKKFETLKKAKAFYRSQPAGFKTNQDSVYDFKAQKYTEL